MKRLHLETEAKERRLKNEEAREARRLKPEKKEIRLLETEKEAKMHDKKLKRIGYLS